MQTMHPRKGVVRTVAYGLLVGYHGYHWLCDPLNPWEFLGAVGVSVLAMEAGVALVECLRARKK
jgi:hypothetical protein